MSQADLPRSRPAAAADEAGVAYRVVGRAKRPLCDQGRVRGQEAADAVDLRHLQRLLRRHGG